jgi:hypothetical protein
MKKLLPVLFTILLFFLTPCFFAQQVIEHTVYFDSGKDTPTREEKAELEEVLKNITNKKLNYSISICGHTDNIGSEQFNIQLSANRAKNIAAYLKKEFKTNRMEVVGRSYTEPASLDTTLSAKARNRRVYISISIPVPQINNIGGIKLDKREYTIDADKNDTLIYSSGTKLMINSGIFVDEQGNKISGKVTISYVEFRDPIDFILSGTHMNYADKGQNMIFNSSGMFDISGKQGDKPVFIKKGEEIKVEFVPTKNIEPGTDFYKYNTSQNKWSDLSNVHSAANSFAPVVSGHGNIINQLEICSRDMCEGTRMVVQTGCELTKDKTPVFTNLVKKYDLDVPHIRALDDSVKKYDVKLEVVKKTLDSIHKEMDEKPAYTFRKIDSPYSSAFAFKIDCDTSLKNNFVDMENVAWYCNSRASKRIASDLIGTKVYAVKMIKLDKRGNAILKITKKAGDRKNPLLDVKMEFPEEKMKSHRKEIYTTYRQRVKAAKEYTKSLEKEQNIANAKESYFNVCHKVFNDSLTNELRNVNKDSAECFWANNKPFMKPVEKEMIMLFWYEHFQKNVDLYDQVYNQMRTNNAVDDTCAAVTKRIEAAIEKAKREGQTLVAATQIMVSLSVGSFGVFNCDQIERLKRPQTITPFYADADGNDLKISTVYLIDDAINSVLTYNGYMDFSPYKFPYSPLSNNRLIAFDEKGDPWLCSYESFKKTVTAKDKKIFILKKVNAVKNKEDLSAMN